MNKATIERTFIPNESPLERWQTVVEVVSNVLNRKIESTFSDDLMSNGQ
jgi:hypothetical protein